MNSIDNSNKADCLPQLSALLDAALHKRHYKQWKFAIGVFTHVQRYTKKEKEVSRLCCHQ
jgi:hypothetical protein